MRKMWHTHDGTSTIITGHSSGAKEFKSLEEVCTQKINTIIDSDSCKNDLALLYNNRGHAKYMQVEFELAVQDYNRALQLNPSLTFAYYNRATIYYRMGDFKEAFYDMQKALDLDPLNKEYNEGYNECLKMTNMQTQ